MKRCFVTGITGMLGFGMARELYENGCQIKALIRKSSRTEHLKAFNIDFVRGDLFDRELLVQSMKDCDIVIHAAALMSDWGKEEEFMRVNVEGTKSVFNAAVEANVKKFIYISSIAVYGQRAMIDVDESAPYGTGNAYYRSKTLAEQYVMDNKEKIPAVSLRFPWIYGPNDRTSLPQIVRGLKKRQVLYINKGKSLISVINARDAARAISLAIEKDVRGEAFNITSDEKITIRQYVGTIAKITNLPPPPISLPSWALIPAAYLFEFLGKITKSEKPPLLTHYRIYLFGENHHVSCEKAKKMLGYRPTIKIDEGLNEALVGVDVLHNKS